MNAHAFNTHDAPTDSLAAPPDTSPTPTGSYQVAPRSRRGRSVLRDRQGKAIKLFDQHGAALHTVATALTKDPGFAETLVVAAIMSGVDSGELGQITGRSTARKLAAAVHTAWSCRPAPSGPISEPPGVTSASSTLNALHRLPDDHRAALALCAFGDHTSTQAAVVLGLPATKVSNLLREALVTLRHRRRMAVPS